MRQLSLELFCWEVGRFFTCLSITRPFDFKSVVVHAFLRANSMLASINSAQLPSCSYDPVLSILLYDSQSRTFLLSSFHESFCDRQSSELTLISSGVFCFGSTTSCSTTTLCELGSSPERPSSKGSSYSGTKCDWSPGAWRPGGNVGNTRFMRNCHNWHMVLRRAPCHFFSFFINDGVSLFSTHGSRLFFA